EARRRMQERLARRGLTLAAALCAVAAAAGAASALSTALITTTVGAALSARAGTAAGVSAPVAALANGVTKAMFASKVKTATALLIVGFLATAVGTQIHRALADPPPREAAPPQEAKADKAPTAKPDKADAPADPLPAGAVQRLGATRLRHGRSVSQLVLSPDGTKVAAYGGGYLSLWDTRTGGVVRRVELPKRTESLQASLVWLADGRGIALLQGADAQNVARLQGADGLVWEFTDEKAVPKIPPDWGMPGAAPAAEDNSDWCYAVSPDGKTLAVGRGRCVRRDVGVFDPRISIIPLKPVQPEANLDKDRAILLRPLKTGVAVS